MYFPLTKKRLEIRPGEVWQTQCFHQTLDSHRFSALCWRAAMFSGTSWFSMTTEDAALRDKLLIGRK